MADPGNGATLIITDDQIKALLTIRDETAFNADAIQLLLQEKKIKFGLNQALLNALLARPRRGVFVIARGQPPREGQDGYVEYTYTDKTPLHQGQQDTSSVDFREIFNIPSVTEGTLLAVYHPMEPGEKGMSVTGRVLLPPPKRELIVQAGRGAEFGPDGFAVYSKISGRPVVKKHGKSVIVSVDNIYRHAADVDIKSGNLRFNGDVVIAGNVMENMIVDVTGNLQVEGFVSRAGISVGGHLAVQKVITSSKILAGNDVAFFSNIEPKLRDIYQSVVQLDKAAAQLLKRVRAVNRKVKYGQLILDLMDKKFIELNKQLQGFIATIKKLQDRPLPAALPLASNALTGLIGIKALQLDDLEDIKQCLQKALDEFSVSRMEPSNVAVGSLSSSELTATGTVTVTGQGVFNCRIHVLKKVEIKGVLRGGEVYAQDGIKVGEIGGAMGVKTLVRTGKKGLIQANLAYSGSILQVGPRIFTVTEDLKSVRAQLNDEGELMLQ